MASGRAARHAKARAKDLLKSDSTNEQNGPKAALTITTNRESAYLSAAFGWDKRFFGNRGGAHPRQLAGTGNLSRR